MARFRKPSGQPRRWRVMTASARQLDMKDKTEGRQLRALRQGWQSDAWNYRDSITELRYAIQFKANALSRMRLFVGVEPEVGESEQPVPLAEASGIPDQYASAAAEILADLAKDEGQRRTLLKNLSTNIDVAGELYTLGQTSAETGEQEWSIRSLDEIAIKDDGYELREIPDGPQGIIPWVKLDPDLTELARIWVPHPRFTLLADSPLRSMLQECEALLLLRRMIRAEARSRLNRGILHVPDEFSIKVPTNDDEDPEADPVFAELVRAITEPIGDEGVASAYAPIVVRGPGDQELKHLNFTQPFEEQAMKAREELVGNIATGFDLPKEIITGMMDANHWCVDDETEALSRDGWKRQQDLRVGDEVLTLNHDSGLSEWQPVSDFYRAEVTDEPMVAMDGVGHSSLTTPNHRWPVLDGDTRKWATSETLRERHRITLAAPCPRPALGSTDALVELLAWYWTEGSERAGQVSIAQSHTVNPERVASIRQCLTTLYGPAVASLRGSTEPAWREKIQANESSLGGPVTIFYLNTRAARTLIEAAPGKCVLPGVVQGMSMPQLERFIDVSLQGDGWHYRSGGLDMFQSEPARLDALELAGILAGYAVSRQTMTGGERLCLYRSKTTLRPVKAARACARNGGDGMMIREARYTGTIWCPVTKNSTWLARRHGTAYYTGNTAWQIDDNTFRHHLEPHTITCCDALTAGYFRQRLLAAGVPVQYARRMVIWYDPTELVTHPDQTKDAMELYDRHAISAEALLRTAGFSPEDAPGATEILIRLLQNMRTPPPNMVMAAVHQLDPTLTIPPIEAAGQIPGVKPSGVDVGELPEQPALLGPGVPPAAIDSTPPAPEPAEHGEPGPPAITASGATHARASRRLAQIDRDLRTRLQTAANAAMLKQLERVGARLRQRVAKDETLRTKIAHRRNERVSAILGPEIVAASGVDAGALMGEDWETLRGQFHNWTAQAQAQALATAARMAGLEETDPRVVKARAQMGRDRERAWEVMATALGALGTHLLFNPDPNAGPTDWADLNPDTLVQTGVIRAALGVAGGNDIGVDAAGNAIAQLGAPVGQIGTGATIGELLMSAQMVTQGYTWEHASLTQHPFEPHEDLDGVEFTSFESEQLANTSGFPGNAYFFPGDHQGCGCDFAPHWVQAEATAVAEAPTAGE